MTTLVMLGVKAHTIEGLHLGGWTRILNADLTADLPVNECLPAILAALVRGRSVVLKAPPGAGKTTGVPPAILNCEMLSREMLGDEVLGDEVLGVSRQVGGKALLIQPRRLAARSAAARLSTIVGGRLGDDVGYHVRFDKKFIDRTRLIAMTTGMLLRRLHHDPLLEGVGCVVLDEFHERSLEIDLALGMIHRIRTTLRPELRLVVMSATLQPQPIADFLGDAESIVSEGRSYPVDVRYRPASASDRVADQVAASLPDVLRAGDGHVLVFLPGVGEIRAAKRAIEQRNIAGDAVILELYGELAPKQQDVVLAPSTSRKIILATNVAETSITIPGVTAVIDTGLARVMRFDPQLGLPKLMLEPISLASADQRAGRAGRTMPGQCVRLWAEAADRGRRQVDAPEIARGDLADAVLTLASWGERDVMAFPWLTPPSIESVDAAKRLLRRLGAVDATGNITATGREMIAYPLHPRLSRFMVEADRRGVVQTASLAAALLTERDPLRGSSFQAVQTVVPCDVWDRVEKMTLFQQGDQQAVANQAAAKQVLRVAEQIQRMAGGAKSALQADAPEIAIKHCLLAAYPDRVARRRGPGDDRGVMVGGRGVKLDRGSACRHGELFLCVDVDSGGTEATVRAASVIEPAWLDESLITQVDEPFFNPSAKAVVARRRRYFDDLMMAESPITCQPSPQVAAMLADNAAKNMAAVFPSKDRTIAPFIERVQFLTRWMPELELPTLDDQGVRDILEQLCRSRTSFAELKSAPWLDHLKGRYDWTQQQSIDQHAPAKLILPSGNSASIDYDGGKPKIEARIQELFGWQTTPTVAGGRVRVQMHLLGPNYRPQQITEDLDNFWNETYTHVRKELRRRYPKHHWPEDPRSASATPKGLKPK